MTRLIVSVDEHAGAGACRGCEPIEAINAPSACHSWAEGVFPAHRPRSCHFLNVCVIFVIIQPVAVFSLIKWT